MGSICKWGWCRQSTRNRGSSYGAKVVLVLYLVLRFVEMSVTITIAPRHVQL